MTLSKTDSGGNKQSVIVSWSSGKDSTLTLMRLLESPEHEVVGLFTTHVKDSIPFQSTPLDIVKAQAEAIDLPLILQELPEVFPPNDVYQSLVINAIKNCGLDVQAVAFGDMFCNGIEDYRRSYIEPAGWQCVFPLLGESSSSLAKEIIRRDIKTFLTTVDSTQLDGEFVGREFNEALIADLPKSVDPCGEDGEFHTLVYDTPCFRNALPIQRGAVIRKGRFHHQEISLSQCFLS